MFVRVQVQITSVQHLSSASTSKKLKTENLQWFWLLTGQAGVGKSLFCKHFQRELLSIWGESFQNEESLNRNWFTPIYINLSNLKNPKSQAIWESWKAKKKMDVAFTNWRKITNYCRQEGLQMLLGYKLYGLEALNLESKLIDEC